MITRRELLGATALASAALILPEQFARLAGRLTAGTAMAGESRRMLRVFHRTIEVNGRAAKVFGLHQADDTAGISLQAGELFDVVLRNDSPEATIVHWHGLTPPWDQDGVGGAPLPLLEAGSERKFSFPVGAAGTFWMHAHTLQEQNLLAAPLIVFDPAERSRDEQDVVILLHDFSFSTPEEILERLKGGAAQGAMAGMDHSKMGHGMAGGMAGDNAGPAMDLNDVEYDAYLANDRTLEDPEIVQVENGGQVRVRIINGATATAFTIDTGVLEGTLIAVDGQDVTPVTGSRFPIAMGQRLDIRIALPRGNEAFPILALREGARERTGIVLAPANTQVRKLASIGDEAGPVVDLGLEGALRAAAPLIVRAPDKRFDATLTGTMQGYAWGIETKPEIEARRGERVEATMLNASMMAHPMHLHGHNFQVVAIDGQRFPGAMRDTIHVPPRRSVTIAFDAGGPGRWAFHCHHLYHMATGMMATVKVEA